MSVTLGIETFLRTQPTKLKNKRIGLLAHPASVDSKLNHTLDLILNHGGFKLNALFGPEHGILGTAQDMIDVDSSRDARTGLKVKSLYGNTFESLKPSPQDLNDIDVLVCDLQDIGTRYYTYAATIALCMQACAAAKKEVIVLDRPNPIDGVTVEGRLLKPGFESFVGLYPIPVRHGMTMGELARYFNIEENINCELTVIPIEGWHRKSYFDQTGLPWVLPSPNMPTLDTAIVYPGMCLIEATELSEGRGTTRPFEFIGAPFIDPHALAKKLTDEYPLEGVQFRPIAFHPTYQKCAHQNCGGVQLHLTDRSRFNSYRTGLAIVHAIASLYPKDFKWRAKPYEFVADIPAIDLLTGDAHFRESIGSKAPFADILRHAESVSPDFLQKRQKYLLY